MLADMTLPAEPHNGPPEKRGPQPERPGPAAQTQGAGGAAPEVLTMLSRGSSAASPSDRCLSRRKVAGMWPVDRRRSREGGATRGSDL